MKKTKLDNAAEQAAQIAFLRTVGAGEISRGYLVHSNESWVRTPTPEERKSLFPVAQRAAEVARETTKKAKPTAKEKARIAEAWNIDLPRARRVLAMAAGIDAGRETAQKLLSLETWPQTDPPSIDTAIAALSLDETWETLEPEGEGPFCEECHRPFLTRQEGQRFCSVTCGKKQRTRLAKRRARAREKEVGQKVT